MYLALRGSTFVEVQTRRGKKGNTFVEVQRRHEGKGIVWAKTLPHARDLSGSAFRLGQEGGNHLTDERKNPQDRSLATR